TVSSSGTVPRERLRVSGAITMRLGNSMSPMRMGSTSVVMGLLRDLWKRGFEPCRADSFATPNERSPPKGTVGSALESEADTPGPEKRLPTSPEWRRKLRKILIGENDADRPGRKRFKPPKRGLPLFGRNHDD